MSWRKAIVDAIFGESFWIELSEDLFINIQYNAIFKFGKHWLGTVIAFVSALLLWEDTITEATLKEESTWLGLAYSFKGLVPYRYGGGGAGGGGEGMTEWMVLEQ